ncbi:aminodeoxychorismate/anthranilate synthase component II [Candidatus Pelagibacter sp.]|nr:aminodeoxychorismate/anthranilate synthase component II [Candidatus Pelagibacter sp.]
MSKILLIDNYDSFTYNLYHYVSSFNKNVDVKRNDKVNSKDIIKNKYTKIIISPGPGNPNQAGNCLKIVNQFYKKIPILGVCLGHQIIGQVFGSKIIQAKKLMHGKTSLITNKKLGVLKGIKNKFTATRYHSLIVDRATLSNDLIVTATTDDNIIMGLMHNKYQIHGVQFHPESINTKVGMKIIENFVKI